MTTIIPLRNGDDGRYLRYALRSIAAQGIGRCILVGGKPRWYTGEHLPHQDYTPERKEENIRDKVWAACGMFHVEDFIFANDDHYTLSPPIYLHNKGLLSDTLAGRHQYSSYTKLLRNTIDRYGDVPNVDTHCCIPMTAAGVEHTMFEWPVHGLGFKTCYCQENGIETVCYPDMKLDRPASLNERLWFSTSDIYPVKDLQNKWPRPCKFEKEYIPSP